MLPEDALDCDNTQAPDICRCGVLLTSEPFRAHILHGTAERMRQDAILAEPKVGKLGTQSRLGQQNVLGFDVAMKDILSMKVLQP